MLGNFSQNWAHCCLPKLIFTCKSQQFLKFIAAKTPM